MSRLRAFFGSMAGRIFIISVLGAIASAALALGLSTAKQRVDHHQARMERLTDRVQDYYSLTSSGPLAVRAQLVREGIPKLRPARPDAVGGAEQADVTRTLRARLGAASQASAALTDPSQCFPTSALPQVALKSATDEKVDCWLVRLRLKDGAPVRMTYNQTRSDEDPPAAADPVYFLILIVGVGAAALVAARMAAAPLHELSKAAASLSGDLDRSPLSEHGPSEVRAAARAFNAMQAVLRRQMKERHQMLASITHDLQTPLTRLRLRVEKVADEAVRERLIADLAAMQLLIGEGLELARGEGASEAPARFDLDSLLHSLTADAADAGSDASFVHGCGCVIQARPNGLRRAVSNLVENALKYAGAAEVAADHADGWLTISVRDRGPGLPPDQLQAVLEPFVRLESSRSRETGGVGLGLTIARILTEKNGGVLSLANRPGGGLEAVITLPAATVVERRTKSRGMVEA